jgi:hypothetical protein
MPSAHRAALCARALEVAPSPNWHGPFDPDVPSLDLDLYRPGDIRPVWERNRWAELPLLAQAARLDPTGPHLPQADALLENWLRANPPFRGPNWACGQEAALRALHLALSIALLGGESSRAAAVLAAHGRRIAATRSYAVAQDNTHTVSEPAGLLICGLLCSERAWVRRGAAALDAAVLRLIAPCGAFAAASTGYHRLLLDVLAVTEWLRCRFGGPALGKTARERAASAVTWLARLTERNSGATPRLGHQDDSAFADLALAGPGDARASIERSARLFCGATFGLTGEPGCVWLGLPVPAQHLAVEQSPRWQSDGFLGWRAGSAMGVLRTGAPRLLYRPGHADLLHFELWRDGRPLLRDSGTGSYNAPPGEQWWHEYFTGIAAHNSIVFDQAEPMRRAGRFLFLDWPQTGLLPAGVGAWSCDRRGFRHTRSIRHDETGTEWSIEDKLSGRFSEVALRWHLSPADGWSSMADGAQGERARMVIQADAPLAISIEGGWHSPRYGGADPTPILVARGRAPISRLRSLVRFQDSSKSYRLF